MRVTLSVWCEACCTCSRKGKAKERYLAARKQGRSSVPVALPLGPERSNTVRSTSSGSVRSSAWYAHPRVAVWGALPLAPERSGRTATRPRTFQHGTLTAEWQCTEHCPVRSPPSGRVRRTATRPPAFQSHCHSPLNVPSCTFISDWQCETHCRAPLEVLLVCSARLPGPHWDYPASSLPLAILREIM